MSDPGPEYHTWDREEKLGPGPWRSSDPAVQLWERAHGHDVRLKCYAELGCQLVVPELERQIKEGIEALTAERDARLDLAAKRFGPEGRLTLLAEVKRIHQYASAPLPPDRGVRLLAVDDRMGRVVAWLGQLHSDLTQSPEGE